MNLRPQMKLFLLVFSLSMLALPMFQGCNPIQEDVLVDPPRLQAEEGEGETPPPCSGSIYYPVELIPVPVSDYYPEAMPYDYAVMVSGTPETAPPVGCFCSSSRRCLTLTFSPVHVEHAGIAKVIDANGNIGNITQVQLSTSGEYIGYEDPTASPGTVTNTFCNTIPEHPFVVFFNLSPSFPPGMNMEDALSGGYGICVIGDLPDPKADPNGGNNH